MEKEYLQDVLAVLQVRTKDLIVHWGAAAAIMDFSTGAGADMAGRAAIAATRMVWKCMMNMCEPVKVDWVWCFMCNLVVVVRCCVCVCVFVAVVDSAWRFNVMSDLEAGDG